MDDDAGGRELLTAIRAGRCRGGSFLFDLDSAVVRVQAGLVDGWKVGAGTPAC